MGCELYLNKVLLENKTNPPPLSLAHVHAEGGVRAAWGPGKGAGP